MKTPIEYEGGAVYEGEVDAEGRPHGDGETWRHPNHEHGTYEHGELVYRIWKLDVDNHDNERGRSFDGELFAGIANRRIDRPREGDPRRTHHSYGERVSEGHPHGYAIWVTTGTRSAGRPMRHAGLFRQGALHGFDAVRDDDEIETGGFEDGWRVEDGEPIVGEDPGAEAGA